MIYAGINGNARNINKIYVGINGVARKVIKGYIGVNGKAIPFFPSGSGIWEILPIIQTYNYGDCELIFKYDQALRQMSVEGYVDHNSYHYFSEGAWILSLDISQFPELNDKIFTFNGGIMENVIDGSDTNVGTYNCSLILDTNSGGYNEGGVSLSWGGNDNIYGFYFSINQTINVV